MYVNHVSRDFTLFFVWFVATRYHPQIPNQPFVVLTSHRNERYYLLVRDDDDDCFKVNIVKMIG